MANSFQNAVLKARIHLKRNLYPGGVSKKTALPLKLRSEGRIRLIFQSINGSSFEPLSRQLPPLKAMLSRRNVTANPLNNWPWVSRMPKAG